MDRSEAEKLVSEDCRQYLDNIVDMLNAPFFRDNGMEAVRISMEGVEIRKKVVPSDRNSNGFWHGGIIYGVMDHAFAILTNSEGHAVVQNSNVNFYRPGRGDIISVKARFVNVSRSLYHVYVEAFDGEKLVASGISTAFRLQEVHS